MFTARSLSALGMSLVLLLLALSSQSPWLYWMSALVLSVLLVSSLSASLQVRKVHLALENPVRAPEGEEPFLRLSVRNVGRSGRHLLLLRDLGPAPLGKSEAVICGAPRLSRKDVRPYLPRTRLRRLLGSGGMPSGRDYPFLLIRQLNPGDSKTIEYRRGRLRRGVYRHWQFLVYSEGILGIGRAWRVIKVPCLVLVRPRFVVPERLFFTLHHPTHSRNALAASRSGRGPYCSGVREYAPGDPPRDIHWKAFAHHGYPMVKIYDEESGLEVAVVIHNGVDLNGPADLSGPLDVACRVAASLAAYFDRKGIPLLLRVTRGEDSYPLHPQDLDRALDWLSAVAPSSDPDEPSPAWMGTPAMEVHLFPLPAGPDRGDNATGRPACLVRVMLAHEPVPTTSTSITWQVGDKWAAPGTVVFEGDDLKGWLEGSGINY